jgi:sterol-4alpha-carboxylate 3-dehydrogenase (decarboxylating)
MSKRAVVIGGAGFVGRRLVAMLAGPPLDPRWPRFDEVLVIDRVAFAPLEETSIPVRAEKIDITSRGNLASALAGAHTIFHTASVVDVGLRPNPVIDAVNIEGTRNVCEVAAALGVPFLVYTSSEDVALSETPVRGADETLAYPLRPIHDYVRTKIEGEKIALAADGARGMRTVSVRPVHVYGPGDPHAIRTSLQAFAKGTVPFLLGDGRARFDVVYVDNVVHGHLLAASRLADPTTSAKVAGRAYLINEGNAPNYFAWLRPYAAAKRVRMPRFHLGRRRTRALARAMELVHRLTGADVPFHSFHSYVICEDFFFSGERARHELGYTPLVTPAEGEAHTVRWVQSIEL